MLCPGIRAPFNL